jgi:hypothetical protein
MTVWHISQVALYFLAKLGIAWLSSAAKKNTAARVKQRTKKNFLAISSSRIKWMPDRYKILAISMPPKEERSSVWERNLIFDPLPEGRFCVYLT